jgi:hypothetical protein
MSQFSFSSVTHDRLGGRANKQAKCNRGKWKLRHEGAEVTLVKFLGGIPVFDLDIF